MPPTAAIVAASPHPHSRFVTFDGWGHNDLFSAPAYFTTLDAWLRDALALATPP